MKGVRRIPHKIRLIYLERRDISDEVASGMLLVGAVPVEEALYAVLDLYLMVPAKAVELLYRGELAHRAVGLGAVPLDKSLEADGAGDKLCQLSDRDLLPRTDIDVAVADGATILGAE